MAVLSLQKKKRRDSGKQLTCSTSPACIYPNLKTHSPPPQLLPARHRWYFSVPGLPPNFVSKTPISLLSGSSPWRHRSKAFWPTTLFPSFLFFLVLLKIPCNVSLKKTRQQKPTDPKIASSADRLACRCATTCTTTRKERYYKFFGARITRMCVSEVVTAPFSNEVSESESRVGECMID